MNILGLISQLIGIKTLRLTPWIPDLLDFKPQPRSENVEIQCLAITQLMNPDKVSWNTGLLKQLFDDASVKAILNIPQWFSHQADSWTWIHSSNRDLSVKSTFKEISKSNLLPPNNPILAKIWKAKIHDRLKLFL